MFYMLFFSLNIKANDQTKFNYEAEGGSNGKSFGPYRSTYAQCQSPTITNMNYVLYIIIQYLQ